MSTKRMSKKRKMQIRRRNRRIALFCSTLLVIGLVFLGILILKNRGDDSSEKDQDKTENPVSGEKEPGTQMPDPGITVTPSFAPAEETLPSVDMSVMDSRSGILMRLEDGRVIAEKEADEKIYPASMTKIMTAIVGLENINDLNETIGIRRDTYDRLYLEGASMAGFVPGDQVKAVDIIYGVMLPSGAECCASLGEYLFGSEEALVEKMNEKAQQLGMANTHFVTSTGLHDPEHYTTVRDLTKLLSYALENETFRMIYSSHEYTTSPTAGNPSGLHFFSTMFKKMNSSSVNGGEIEGGKTGYTSDAGQCLASLAKVDGEEYILITAGAQGGPSTEPYHIYDAIAVYNQISAGK